VDFSWNTIVYHAELVIFIEVLSDRQSKSIVDISAAAAWWIITRELADGAAVDNLLYPRFRPSALAHLKLMNNGMCSRIKWVTFFGTQAKKRYERLSSPVICCPKRGCGTPTCTRPVQKNAIFTRSMVEQCHTYSWRAVCAHEVSTAGFRKYCGEYRRLDVWTLIPVFRVICFSTSAGRQQKNWRFPKMLTLILSINSKFIEKFIYKLMCNMEYQILARYQSRRAPIDKYSIRKIYG